MDLIESRIVNEPFKKVERALNAYDFFPVKNQDLKDIEGMFIKKSKILRPEHFTVDFFIECIPPQGILKAELIY